MAPVSNPAITVAVVIDTPTVGTGYGGTVSAPVFAEVAQEVLEYLGVPHDQPLKTKKQMQQAAQVQIASNDLEDGPKDNGADLNAMFADVNNLPEDDPLRATVALAASAPVQTAAVERKPTGVLGLLPDKVLAAFHANGGTNSIMPDSVAAKAPLAPPKITPQVVARAGGGVVVDAGQRVPMPDFHGAPLRGVIERAGSAGLRVQPVGNGLATEQVPAAGTMVPVGTEVVVRFAR